MTTRDEIVAPGRTVMLDGGAWRIAAADGADGPWKHAGRVSTVYRVESDVGGARALKAMAPGGPSTTEEQPWVLQPHLAPEHLGPWRDIPGLAVAHRTIVGAPESERLAIPSHGSHTIIMPWVDGPSWEVVISERWDLTPQQCLRIARALADVLNAMEARGIAHCQLSGHHLLLPCLAGRYASDADPIGLVDLERCYGPGLKAPAPGQLAAGLAGLMAPEEGGAVQQTARPAAGYGHRTGDTWSPAGDRFAGAVLLAEALGWCDPVVRESAAGSGFFADQEVGQEGQRYRLLLSRLRERWGGEITRLFRDAWGSVHASACPPFAEWLNALPDAYRPAERSFVVSYSARRTAAESIDGVEIPVSGSTAVEEVFPYPRQDARRRGWWVVPAGLFVTAALAAGIIALSPSPFGRPPEAASFRALEVKPPPVQPDLSEIHTPGLAREAAWERARVAFEGGSWSDSIRELVALREGGQDAPEVRTLLFAALVNRGDGLLDGGDQTAALSDYQAARDLDPENESIRQRLSQWEAPRSGFTPTLTPRPSTSTPEPGPGGPSSAVPAAPAADDPPSGLVPGSLSTPTRTATSQPGNASGSLPTSTATPQAGSPTAVATVIASTPTFVPTRTPTEVPPTPTEEPEPTSTLEPTETPTRTPTVTRTPTRTATVTRTPTPTQEPTSTPTEEPTSTPTEVPANTPVPTSTPTEAPAEVPTEVPAQTPTVPAGTPTPEPTQAASPTAEPTQAPSPTAEPTHAASPTAEPTHAASPTAEPTQAPSPTAEPTHAPSPTAEPTQAPSATAEPTEAPEPTRAPSPVAGPTQASAPKPTNTPQLAATSTPEPAQVPTKGPAASATP